MPSEEAADQTLSVATRREKPANEYDDLGRMSHDVSLFGFPLWLRLTHYINFLFFTLLVRSGIQILSDHPRLYWNKHCTPGSEWLKLTKKVFPKNKAWTSMDEAVDVSPWIALPGGRHNLGLGRHWQLCRLPWMLASPGIRAFSAIGRKPEA